MIAGACSTFVTAGQRPPAGRAAHWARPPSPTACHLSAPPPRSFSPRARRLSSSAVEGAAETAAGNPPSYEGRWNQLSLEQQVAYLEAYRDFYGEGVVVHSCSIVGTPVVALVDSEAVSWFEDWSPWCQDSATMEGQLISRARNRSVTILHRTAAKQLLEPSPMLANEWVGMRVTTLDGCLSNCMARNLWVQPRHIGGRYAMNWADWLREQEAAGRPLHPQLQRCAEAFWAARRAWQQEQRAAPEMRKRQARARAEAFVEELYSLLGPERARQVLAAAQQRAEEHTWKQLSLEQQVAYLEAYRDFYGECEVVYSTSPRGNTVVALVDPAAVSWFKDLSPWYQTSATMDGHLQSAVTGASLHRVAAGQLLEPSPNLADQWQGMRVTTLDGCLSNCVARNLWVQPRHVGGRTGQNWADWLREQEAAGRSLHPQLQRCAEAFWAREAQLQAQRAAELEKALEQRRLRAIQKVESSKLRAQEKAREVLQLLYRTLGAQEARSFLAAEQQRLEEQQQEQEGE
ncbi:hypothetical protein ABPG75_011336 [Micractinium tetrahymenae]